MKEAGIDVIRAVWSAEYPPLHVEPSAECPGYVRLVAKQGESEGFWGRLDVTMPREFALLLAKAIHDCASEQEEA